jgi:hypothetical protein
VEQSKWNYLLEKEDEEGEDDEDDSKDDEDGSDVDSKENATSSPTISNKKRKYNAVQGIITPGYDDMKANSNMAKSYPYLLRALGGEDGFDPTNPSVKRSMHELLKEGRKSVIIMFRPLLLFQCLTIEFQSRIPSLEV